MRFADETKLEVWLSLREDGALGDGSAANSYDASSPTLFRDRMKSFYNYTKVIHLGPGIFQTPAYDRDKYFNDLDHIWIPNSGWRIEGAGMFLTTIKVVGADQQLTSTLVIGSEA